MKLQEQILDDTAPFIKIGGQMVYSTCSVWPEENGQRVDGILKRHVEFELLASQSYAAESGSGSIALSGRGVLGGTSPRSEPRVGEPMGGVDGTRSGLLCRHFAGGR